MIELLVYQCVITSPREGVARYCFHPVCLSVCLSVCVCVCLCVCPADILVFYFSAIRRDIDLKFIQDTYGVRLNSLKKTLFDETIKTRASREMTSQKIRQYLTLTCKTPILKLLILIKLSIKILKLWQSYSPFLFIFSISVPNLVTIGGHLTSFLTCATFNM